MTPVSGIEDLLIVKYISDKRGINTNHMCGISHKTEYVTFII